MIDERAEFAAYTEAVVYDATNKQDSAYLGRFTFDTLLRGEGLQRVLTIVARGYLWQTDKPDMDRARNALRAWCSIPDSKKAKPKEAWQYGTDFRQLHGAFPVLVDEQGNGWFVRHVHGVRDFLKHHPEKVSKPALKNLEPLSHGWDAHWRGRVRQFQVPIFSPETKGGWVLRFDDILADALELGSLRSPAISLPPGLEQPGQGQRHSVHLRGSIFPVGQRRGDPSPPKGEKAAAGWESRWVLDDESGCLPLFCQCRPDAGTLRWPPRLDSMPLPFAHLEARQKVLYDPRPHPQ